MENNKTTPVSVLEPKGLKHPLSSCSKEICLILQGNNLICVVVFDRAGEVSGRFQPPSQSQTLSRKKISWIFEANHYFCGDDQQKVG